MTHRANVSNQQLITWRAYDFLNRLTSINHSKGIIGKFSTFDYAYNLAGQRTAVTNLDALRWAWQYDNLGQVTSGKRVWSDGTSVAGQQYEYVFDNIGNRKSAASGGDPWGGNLRNQSCSATALNEYSQRTVPGSIDVVGSANVTRR